MKTGSSRKTKWINELVDLYTQWTFETIYGVTDKDEMFLYDFREFIEDHIND